jgi:hypothetical protein
VIFAVSPTISQQAPRPWSNDQLRHAKNNKRRNHSERPEPPVTLITFAPPGVDVFPFCVGESQQPDPRVLSSTLGSLLLTEFRAWMRVSLAGYVFRFCLGVEGSTCDVDCRACDIGDVVELGSSSIVCVSVSSLRCSATILPMFCGISSCHADCVVLIPE